jgi:hypothetical protein
MSREEKATFIASFPPIMSAIKIYGTNDGMRIQLDVPESEMAEAVKLLAWRMRALRVIIEPTNETEKNTKGSTPAVDSRRTTIRRDK